MYKNRNLRSIETKENGINDLITTARISATAADSQYRNFVS